jgi:hypothetical protein
MKKFLKSVVQVALLPVQVVGAIVLLAKFRDK